MLIHEYVLFGKFTVTTYPHTSCFTFTVGPRSQQKGNINHYYGAFK